jgi:hypothetical protein
MSARMTKVGWILGSVVVVGVGLSLAVFALRASATGDATCAADVAGFERWLATLPSQDEALPTVMENGRRPVLVELAGKVSLPSRRGAYVTLGADLIEVEDNPTERFRDLQEVGPALEKAKALWKAESGNPPLLLAIDPVRPWSDVVAIAAAAARTGFEEIDFIFLRSSRAAPAPSSLDGELDRIMRVEELDRARQAAMFSEKFFTPCKPMGGVFAHIGGVGPAEKVAVMVAELPAALRECHCAVSPKETATLVWLWQGPDPDKIIRRVVVGARVRLGKPGQPATALRAATTEPWSKASAAVLAAGATASGEIPSVTLAVAGGKH